MQRWVTTFTLSRRQRRFTITIEDLIMDTVSPEH